MRKIDNPIPQREHNIPANLNLPWNVCVEICVRFVRCVGRRSFWLANELWWKNITRYAIQNVAAPPTFIIGWSESYVIKSPKREWRTAIQSNIISAFPPSCAIRSHLTKLYTLLRFASGVLISNKSLSLKYFFV